MTVPERTFRPGPVRWRGLLPTVFLFVLALVGAVAMTLNPAKANLSPLALLVLLVGSGLWMEFRLRWPGDPRLQTDAKGLRYIRGDRESTLTWAEVEAIETDFIRNEMHFVANDRRTVKTYRSLVSNDGEWFDILVEDYWQPPAKDRRGRKPAASSG